MKVAFWAVVDEANNNNVDINWLEASEPAFHQGTVPGHIRDAAGWVDQLPPPMPRQPVAQWLQAAVARRADRSGGLTPAPPPPPPKARPARPLPAPIPLQIWTAGCETVGRTLRFKYQEASQLLRRGFDSRLLGQ